MEFHVPREKSDPRQVGFTIFASLLVEVSESNPLSSKAQPKEAIYTERRQGCSVSRFYRSSKVDPCLQPEIGGRIVSPWMPHVELAKFAELGVSRGNLLFEDHCQKLPYEVG